MKTIQMTLDDELVEAVDKTVKKLKTSRSAFTRKALKNAINNIKVKELEKKQIKGYLKHPIDKNEFNVWENEQDWGDK